MTAATFMVSCSEHLSPSTLAKSLPQMAKAQQAHLTQEIIKGRVHGQAAGLIEAELSDWSKVDLHFEVSAGGGWSEVAGSHLSDLRRLETPILAIYSLRPEKDCNFIVGGQHLTDAEVAVMLAVQLSELGMLQHSPPIYFGVVRSIRFNFACRPQRFPLEYLLAMAKTKGIRPNYLPADCTVERALEATRLHRMSDIELAKLAREVPVDPQTGLITVCPIRD